MLDIMAGQVVYVKDEFCDGPEPWGTPLITSALDENEILQIEIVPQGKELYWHINMPSQIGVGHFYLFQT